MFFRLFVLELRSLSRDVQGLLMPVVFVLTIAVLFPLALSPEAAVLQKFAVGISWLAALLSLMLTLDHFYRNDKEQATLEQYLAGGINLIWYIQAKIFAYWITTAVPLAFASLITAFVCSLPIEGYVWLCVSLCLGLLIMLSLGAFMSSITLNGNHSSMLIVCLLVPLVVPVIIFSVQLVEMALNNADTLPLLSMLIGMALMSIVLAPLFVALALRHTLD